MSSAPAPTAASTTTAPGGLGLFGRTFWLLFALFFLSTAVVLQTFRLYIYEPYALRSAEQVASLVNLTRMALSHTDAIARVSLVKILADEESVQILTREPSDEFDLLKGNAEESQVANELMRLIGPGTVVASRVNQVDGLWIGFSIERDSYWLQMDPSRLSLITPKTWLLWAAAALGLSLIGSILIARLLSRPLKRLAEAAGRVRSGQFEELGLDTRSGTREIHEVNTAFARMAAQLSQAEKDRTLMLAGISHDLRTPLSRLRLEAELSVSDPNARELIVADIGQIDSMLNKFLDYARPASGLLDQVRLHDLLGDLARSYAQDAELRLQVQLPPEAAVRADPVELLRVLTNLIENARRYGRLNASEPVHVDIWAEPQSALHDLPRHTLPSKEGETASVPVPAFWQIHVRDHGRGVPTEQLPLITQAFYRGDAARSEAAGTGLGLAVVQSAMVRMGGALHLANHPDGGLWVSLTLAAAAVPRISPAA